MKNKLYVYILIVLCLQGIKLYTVNKLEPGQIEVVFKDYMGVLYEETTTRPVDKERMLRISSIHMSHTIKGRIRKEVEVIGTEYTFKNQQPLEMVSGSFFTQASVDKGENRVIISDELAETLYGTHCATQNQIIIGDTTYEVIGVYKRFPTFMAKWNDDTVEKVYIPITSQLTRGKQITHMVFLATHKDYAKEIPRLVNQNLKQSNINQASYILYNDIDENRDNYRPKKNIIDIPFYIKQFLENHAKNNYRRHNHISEFYKTYLYKKNQIKGINLIQLICVYKIIINLLGLYIIKATKQVKMTSKY